MLKGKHISFFGLACFDLLGQNAINKYVLKTYPNFPFFSQKNHSCSLMRIKLNPFCKNHIHMLNVLHMTSFNEVNGF